MNRAQFRPCVLLLAAASTAAGAAEPEGQALYQQRCAPCHESGQSGIPPRAQLHSRSADFIAEKLLLGSMQAQTLGLSEQQISEIAQYLAQEPPPPPAQTVPPAQPATPAQPAR